MRSYRYGYQLALALCFALCTLSAQGLTLSKNESSYRLFAEVSLLEDPAGQLSREEASSPAMRQQFRRWTGSGDINLGFSESAYWLRLTLSREEDAPGSWLIEIPYLSLDTIDFYAQDEPPVFTGASRLFSTRPVAHRYFLFPVTVTTEPRDIYLRIRSHYALTVPLNLWTPESFYEDAQQTLTIQALYFGGLLALLVYNFFLWVSLRDRRFLYYVLFCSLLGMGIFAGNGFGRLFIWPDAPGFDVVSQSLLISTALIFGIEFAVTFLKGREVAPRATQALRVAAVTCAVVAVLLLASLWISLPMVWIYQVFILTSMLATPLILWIAVRAWRARVTGARFFMLAWCLLLGGGIVGSLRALSLFPTNVFTAYSVQIASAAEMLLLALALADTVRHEREEREQAQRRALATSDALMQVMKESEQRLERAVADRTGQLNSALANERAILSQYQRFGALISHEFRNPLGIIDSQVALMRKTSATEDSRLGGRLDVISGATQRLVKMFDQWLSDGQVRADIRPMKRSRILISDWLPQCLQENRMYAEQHVIEIRLDDSAMQLQADQELLDIALVNLLDNACKYSPAGSRIVIAATRKPGYIGISVIDQGSGIAPEHHERIFDDYVRIPSAGGARGTGLGLPFVKNIVNNHLGHISLTSASGEGSSFTLWFPEEPGPDTTQSASEAVPA